MEAAVRKRHGVHYTPPNLAKFLAEQTARQIDASQQGPICILDPACGDGELLVALINSLPCPLSQIQVIGVEQNIEAAEIARNRVTQLNVGRCEIRVGDFLSEFEKHSLVNSFDIVICGWTVSYSNSPQQLADEMSRVCKDGGLIAVGLEYSTLDEAGYQELLGYSLAIPGVERINSVQQINQLFEDQLDQVFFSHDAPLKRSHSAKGLVAFPSSVASIFSIKK